MADKVGEELPKSHDEIQLEKSGHKASRHSIGLRRAYEKARRS